MLARRSVFLAALFAMVAVLASAGGAGAASYPSQTPTSSVGAGSVTAGQADRYCVSNYAPDSTVTVTGDGLSYTIQTNAQGAGCTTIYPGQGCHVYTASGQNAAGQQVTSTATICGVGAASSSSSSSGGALPFTGANVVALVAAGLLLLALGSAFALLGRRRLLRRV